MPFDFSYSVNDAATANDYAHKAVSDGDVTRGEYRVALPDGRTQIVRYTADWKNGYNAEVSRAWCNITSILDMKPQLQARILILSSLRKFCSPNLNLFTIKICLKKRTIDLQKQN